MNSHQRRVKRRTRVNVMDYWDGGHDEHGNVVITARSFTAAVVAARRSRRREVYFPPGNYRMRDRFGVLR